MKGSFHIAYAAKRKVPPTSVIGEPLSLCHSQALELAHTNDTQDLQQYFVDVTFTVTSEGGVSNVSLLDSNAPTRLQRYVTNTLRQVRYRPTSHEGQAVDTQNIKLHQTITGDSAHCRGFSARQVGQTTRSLVSSRYFLESSINRSTHP